MARQQANVRLEADVIQLARNQARKEYGKESEWGRIVESAIRKYVSSDLSDSEFQAIMNATDGEFLNLLYKKIESEFTTIESRLVDKVGNLIAKSSYESTLTSLLMEKVFFSQKGNTKLLYEELRGRAAKRLKGRYELEGTTYPVDGNQNQGNQIELKLEASEEIAQLKKEKEEAEQIADRWRNEAHKVDQSRSDLLKWTRGLVKEIEGSGMMANAKGVLKEYERKNPRPRGV